MVAALMVVAVVLAAPPAHALTPGNTLDPNGDEWGFWYSPPTLACSAVDMTIRQNPWPIGQGGYCGVFVIVNNHLFGNPGVRCWPWEGVCAVPDQFTEVSSIRRGNGQLIVDKAGDTGVQVTLDAAFNGAGDGWLTTVTLTNLGDAVASVDGRLVASVCSPWNGVNAAQALYDPTTKRSVCRNGPNVVSFEPPQPGVGQFNGASNYWGQYKNDDFLAPGASLSWTTQIIWRKDGVVPAEAQPLPSWAGLDVSQSYGGGSPDVSAIQCDCADPVNSATGEYWQTDSDMKLAGRSPLDLTRTYSSMAGSSGGLFGDGWSSLLDTHVVPGNPTVVVHANGARTLFTPSADGSFAADPDVRATLSKDAGTGAYTYSLREGNSYVFDSDGALTAIIDKNGETTQVARASSSVTVTTPDGRAATYHLNSDGRATQLLGPEGRSITYAYNPAGQLSTVTDARGSNWSFEYDATGRMVTDTAPISGSITTTYDAAGRVATQTNRRGGVTTFDYSVAGTQSTTRMVDPSGVVTDFAYNHGLLASTTVDPNGTPATWSYTYDSHGNQTTATTPTGERVWQTWDARDRLLTRVDVGGNVTRYTYGELDEPLTMTDDHATTTYTYDTVGNLLTETRPRNAIDATTTITRDPAHAADVLSVVDADGHTTSYTYDTGGMQSSVTAGDGGETTWSRNAYGQPLIKVAPRGNATGAVASQYATAYAYDAAGGLTSETDPLGHTTTYGLDAEGRTTSVTNALGKTSHITILDDGNIGSATDAAGHTTTYTLDLAGKLLATTAPDGSKTTTTYDGHGWPITVTSPTGNADGASTATTAAYTETLTHDLAGRVTSTTVPNPDDPAHPIVNSTTYNYAGWVGSTTDALGRVTSYSYTDDGHVSSVTEPDGAGQYFTYDEDGDQLTASDELNHVTTTTYSPGGQTLSVKNPANETTRYTYDSAGRLRTIVDGRGTCSGCNASNYTTTYGYDLDGNQTTQTDQLGRVTTSTYDQAGRLTSVKDANNHSTGYTYDADNKLLTTTAPDGGATTVGYDDIGNVASLRTPRGNSYTYTYDANGRLLTTTDPLGHTRTASYTLEGLISQLVTSRGNTAADPASGTISYSYDTLGRLITTAFGDGATSDAYTYDAASHLIGVTDAVGQETRQYDVQGQLTTLTRNSQTWTYSYNLDGSTSSITRPDQSTETFTYDAAGRTKTAVTAAGTTSYSYDKASNLTQTTNPNGTTESQTWDRTGKLATLTTKKGSTSLVAQTITRDNVGNPTQVAVTRSGKSETRSYLYDANDRLQGVCYVAKTSCTTASNATQYWTYDLDGNRLTEKNGTGTGTTTTNTYNTADQLTSSKAGTATATNYTYDADGNLTTDGTTTWAYDLNNRIAASTTGTTTQTWTRDAQGNPVSISSPTSTSTYQWDVRGGTPILDQSNEAGTLTDYWYDPLGRLSSLATGGATDTVNHDPIGSPIDLVNSTGAIARSYDYTPFGTPRTPVGAPTSPSGPTTSIGYARLLTTADPTTLAGRDRGYLSALGRWTGTDPLGVQTAAAFDTPYSYVGNAANSHVDVLGQSLCDGVVRICDTGKYLLAEDLGAEAAMERLVLSLADPLDTIDQAIQGCRTAATANGGGASGVMACADTLNPIAAIRDGLSKAVTSPCVEESGKALGGSLFNIALIGASLTSGDAAVGAGERGAGSAGDTAADEMTAVRLAGAAGEQAALIVKNAQHIPSLSGTAAYRIPDELTSTTLGEVKNVASLSYTNQLRDFADYAEQQHLTFNLYVRRSTKLSKTLQDEVNAGKINLVRMLW